MLKLFKVKIQDYIDENDNPIITTEYIAAERVQDLYTSNDKIVDHKELRPFKVIE